MNWDIEKIRADFPILQRQIYGRPLVYLDNGATTQKPLQVIQAISEFYTTLNSNIHRGVHFLSEQATEAYEHARQNVQRFVNAQHSHEIVFTRGATESINLVAFSFGERFVQSGDEIIVTGMEHHSNIVPWQMLCERKGAHLRVVPFDDNGELMLQQYKQLLNSRTRMVAMVHVSNSLGTINPVADMIQMARGVGAKTLVDGSQAVQHLAVDVQALDVDFYAFSGHKLYGPTGIGVLYGKQDMLNEIPPYQGGGDMIKTVSFDKTVYNDLPFKFEAGTADFVGAHGLSKAIDYVSNLGINNIAAHENDLLQYTTERLKTIEGLHIYGQSAHKSPVISFLIKGIHPYDAGMVLDKMGIAVRTGTHCTQPVMDKFCIEGTVRASFGLYNTRAEADALYDGLLKVKKMLG